MRGQALPFMWKRKIIKLETERISLQDWTIVYKHNNHLPSPKTKIRKIELWQCPQKWISLRRTSRLLSTNYLNINTHQSLFRFNRLLSGIKGALDIFRQNGFIIEWRGHRNSLPWRRLKNESWEQHAEHVKEDFEKNKTIRLII